MGDGFLSLISTGSGQHACILTLLIFTVVRVGALLVAGEFRMRRTVLVVAFFGLLALFCAPQLVALRACAAPASDGAWAVLAGKIVGGTLAFVAGSIVCQNLGLE